MWHTLSHRSIAKNVNLIVLKKVTSFISPLDRQDCEPCKRGSPFSQVQCTPANISITSQHLKTNHPNEKFSGPNISHIIADFDYYRVDHTMDLVVLMKYGGDWVSITLNATPELFASGAAFGSPPEPVKQIMSFLSHQKCVNNIQKCWRRDLQIFGWDVEISGWNIWVRWDSSCCLWVTTRTCKADNVFLVLSKATIFWHSVSLQRAFIRGIQHKEAHN